MEITITQCRYAPRWDSLQTVIQEATNEPDGKLTRIDREDNGCDYRKPGVYNLSFQQGLTSLPIKLNIVAVGHRQ